MKISRVALLIPLFVALACSSNDNDKKLDASDARIDRFTDGTTTDTAKTDTGTDVATDVATDTAPTDGGADVATDGGGTDVATDGGGGDAPTDGPKAQRFTRTLLVVDSVADGGSDGGASDAGASDAGADASQTLFVDPNLVNPWGLAINPAGPIWVADNGTGLSTVYTSAGAPQALVVTIPTAAGGTPPSAPTGLVFNPTAGFAADKFIFSSEDGTIVGWQTGTTATLRVDNATAHAVYKGLALGLRNNVARLYATDFHNKKVDVFDSSYNKITTTGGFVDGAIPAGFAPFGVQADGSAIFVTYAKQDADAKDDVSGVGNGYVDVFDFDGVLTKRLVAQGMLNSPWAVAMSPADFGGLSHALLVGNFGDGHINAYDPSTGAYLATLTDTTGAVITLPGLWSLVFGNDTPGAAHNQLFFTAGGKMEDHGALGRIDFVP